MGSKLRIIALMFLVTPVYAMGPTKHPEYDQAFDQYIQEAERPIPQSSIPKPTAPKQSSVMPAPEPVLIVPAEVVSVPDRKIATEKDIYIPKYFKYLPPKYREKLIEKRIKKKQAEFDNQPRDVEL